ncbi:MAG: dihydrodipicolinate synthase family protein [Betaproteobacteria bacterium]|nr:dihydrodipicolinate synthase family protein [Betaproteobacteria bacterium]MDH3436835.1 dihydrodipicolinate synthase family protein [Betaproteobacteria bacterium]
MSTFQPGLVHTPVTPFTREHRIDYALYEKIIEFHLRNGADALALPMHAGESVSLTDAERRQLLEFAIRKVNGRVPVIAHVSDSGTTIAAGRAQHAQEAGAAAVITTAPYYWTPPPTMLLEHFAQIGAAVRIPFFIYNAPDEMGGTKMTTDLSLKLIDRLDNFSGIVDASLDWQFMIDVVDFARRVRPAWQLLSGTEYMISAKAIGTTGAFSPLASIAPALVRRAYDACHKEDYSAARKPQEELAALRQLLKKGGVAALKAASRAMGRDCGEPRYPLMPLGEAERVGFSDQLAALNSLRTEPRGW